MTEDQPPGYSSTATTDRVASVLSPVAPRERRRGLFRRRKRRNRRMRWLRLLAIVVPLSFLAVISMVFGMVLAVASQLGPLTRTLETQFTNGANSVVYASDGKTALGILTAKNDFFLPPQDIPPIMAHAIVAIEDKRFYTEPGIDYRGIARAFIADVFHTGGGLQGASTITEQFVKNALNDQKNRTIFNKVREAALAFQLSHHWSKAKILAEYLNTAYFGSGAYGVEAAARAYFGNDPSSNLYQCGITPNANDPASLCVTNLTADEAALLAAAVDSPSSFNGLQDAAAATDRRNLVLREMAQQGYLTADEASGAQAVTLPPPQDVASPSEEATDKSAGYFTSWVADQLVNHLNYGPASGRSIYTGGYRVVTTLDARLQGLAQQTVDHILPPGVGGPAAALVAIDNKTGEVRAMVGGYNYDKNPFNLATAAERQPGSSWKVFDLAAALESGYKYNSPILSKGPWLYPQQPGGPNYGPFVVRNDEGGYFNAKIPLWEALAVSDNSAFARLALEGNIGGTLKIAQIAHDFGISTTISLNPSMVIGGLNVGVTPLDMAHAYQTIANGGRLTTGTLTSYTCVGGDTPNYSLPQLRPLRKTCPGPVGIESISQPQPNRTVTTIRNHTIATQVPGYSYADDQTEVSMMRGVLSSIGTASSAAIPGVPAYGKTGTTSNYADAWFIGSIGGAHGMTVAIWVGYPTSARSMAKGFGGKPVYGGTYPAEIWRTYVQAALTYYAHPTTTAKPPAGGTTSTSSTGATGASGASASSSTGATAATGTSGGTPATQTGTTSPPGGATTPATGSTTQQPTVTSGGGSTIPTVSTPATTTPSGTTGGGVTAPTTGGASAPPAG